MNYYTATAIRDEDGRTIEARQDLYDTIPGVAPKPGPPRFFTSIQAQVPLDGTSAIAILGRTNQITVQAFVHIPADTVAGAFDGMDEAISQGANGAIQEALDKLEAQAQEALEAQQTEAMARLGRRTAGKTPSNIITP
jgi:hypothetical protein